MFSAPSARSPDRFDSRDDLVRAFVVFDVACLKTGRGIAESTVLAFVAAVVVDEAAGGERMVGADEPRLIELVVGVAPAKLTSISLNPSVSVWLSDVVGRVGEGTGVRSRSGRTAGVGVLLLLLLMPVDLIGVETGESRRAASRTSWALVRGKSVGNSYLTLAGVSPVGSYSVSSVC